VKAGELLNIAVLDHIILGQRTSGREQDYVSLKELDLM
jgi:DNA repair protein RadC